MKKYNLLLLLTIACINPLCGMEGDEWIAQQGPKKRAKISNVLAESAAVFLSTVWSFMEDAGENTDLTDLKRFIKKNKKYINEQSEMFQMTLLHESVIEDKPEFATIFLKNGKADPNIQDSEGDTPLLAATQYSHDRLIPILLQHNANPNIQDNEGETSLHWAAITGNINALDELLKKGANLAIQNANLETPLFVAVQQNNEPIVKKMLDHLTRNAPAQLAPIVNMPDNDGNTPLHRTALNHNLSIFKLLLQNDANMNAINDIGQKPFDILAPAEQEEINTAFARGNR